MNIERTPIIRKTVFDYNPASVGVLAMQTSEGKTVAVRWLVPSANIFERNRNGGLYSYTADRRGVRHYRLGAMGKMWANDCWQEFMNKAGSKAGSAEELREMVDKYFEEVKFYRKDSGNDRENRFIKLMASQFRREIKKEAKKWSKQTAVKAEMVEVRQPKKVELEQMEPAEKTYNRRGALRLLGATTAGAVIAAIAKNLGINSAVAEGQAKPTIARVEETTTMRPEMTATPEPTSYVEVDGEIIAEETEIEPTPTVTETMEPEEKKKANYSRAFSLGRLNLGLQDKGRLVIEMKEGEEGQGRNDTEELDYTLMLEVKDVQDKENFDPKKNPCGVRVYATREGAYPAQENEPKSLVIDGHSGGDKYPFEIFDQWQKPGENKPEQRVKVRMADTVMEAGGKVVGRFLMERDDYNGNNGEGLVQKFGGEILPFINSEKIAEYLAMNNIERGKKDWLILVTCAGDYDRETGLYSHKLFTIVEIDEE